MRIVKKYRLIIVFALLFFTGAIGYAQTMTQNEPSQELEEVAKEKTDMWIEELSLTGKQAALMQKKIVEFAIKREKLIQSKMREEAKTERLKALQELEYKDMRDILTQPQFDRYLALKQEIINKQSQNNRK
jgi:HAMP domain-containing protein